MEAQINAMTSEIAHLMDRLAIAQWQKKKTEVVPPFVPCLRQAGDPAILRNVDLWAIKDQVIWPKPTAKVKPRLNEATRDRLVDMTGVWECTKNIHKHTQNSRSPIHILDQNTRRPFCCGGGYHSYSIYNQILELTVNKIIKIIRLKM